MASVDIDQHVLIKCRICLTIEDDMNNLFQPFLEDLSIADILKNISNIELECMVGMPQVICQACTNTIMSFKHLTKVCKDSDDYLRKLVCESDILPSLRKDDDFIDRCLPFDSNGDDVSDTEELKDYNFADAIETRPLSPSDTDSKNIVTGEEQLKVEPSDDSDYIEVTNLKYSCELCGDCYLFKTGFSHHMLMVHNLCIQVNQYAKYSSLVKFKIPRIKSTARCKTPKKNSHAPVLTSATGYLCRKCKEEYPTAEELKIHSEVHKTYRCDQCGAAFIRNSYLRDHLLKHSTEKCYGCKICGQKFKYRSALAVHRRDHFGNYRGHMCETCGKSFKEKGTLKTHIKLKHTNERNFSCSGCGQTFKLKAARDKHFMRKHTDNRTKDFVCFMCGMAYLNKETLTRHMNDKHSDAPSTHWCNVCEKTFTMRSNLLKHLRNKHNVITKHD